MFRRWCAVGFVIGLLLGASQSVYGQFPTLTVSKLAGIRVSAENPPSGLSITSGLVLGLGADLLALGGDVTIQQLASDLAKGGAIESQSGGNLTSGTYCYLLTAFIDDKEVIQGAGASQISVGSGQQVVFRWQVAEELRQVAQFGGKAGYRIYRFGPLPADTQCTAVQLGQYGRLGELELPIPPPASLSFTDDGRRSFIGGAPQLKAGGNLSVEGNATVNLNLTVGALAQVGSLQVGTTPVVPAGNAWIAGSLFLGPKGWEWSTLPGPFFPSPLVLPPTGAASAGPLTLLELFPGAKVSRLQIAGPAGNFTLNLGNPAPPPALAPGSFTIADLAVGGGAFCTGGNPRLQINAAGAVGLGVAPAAGAPAGALEIAHSLGVGAAAPAGCGNVEITGWLRVGIFPAPPPGVAPGTIYFDIPQDALCVFTAKSGWQCLSPAVIINNPTFIQNVINLLIQNNTFIQNLVIAVGGNVTFQQTILQQLIQSVEFRQTIINLLIANVEFRQTLVNVLIENVELRQAIITALSVSVELRQAIVNVLVQSVEFRQIIVNILVADERFKTTVIEALLKDERFLQTVATALRPILDSRYVLKPRDETDLTIGSLMSLGQLAGDWLVVGEPRDNKNFWALINPDNGPNLALGTVEPPNLSRLTRTVMEFERATGNVRILTNLEVSGNLTIRGALSLEYLTINRDLRVLGFTDVGNVRGRDAEFDNLILNRDLRVRGVKFFIEQHPTDPTKEIAYAALEGPEAGTYIRGSAELKDGQAVIALPEHFALVTSEEGLTVQLTPIGEWLQLYVVELSPQKLVVREAQGKSGKFFYLVQGVRRGYEQLPVIQEKQKGP
ncbi:MAG: hypothetical protein QXD59_03110 [Candidatus Caldarchaeum sp.]